MGNALPPGAAGWIDLTVDDGEGLRDFYAAVVGWKPEPVPMGDYADFNMTDAAGVPCAGVCHRRGANATQPSGWMVYFLVEDLDVAVAACKARGGRVLVERREASFIVIEDPSGAHRALYQAPAS